MRELLPALTDEEKTEIKRELDHIGMMILTFEDDDDYLSITLRPTGISNRHLFKIKLNNLNTYILSHKMKFPITREILQAFDYAKEQEELKEEEIQKRLTLIIDGLCKEFKQAMPSNSKEKKFVWRGLDYITMMHHQDRNSAKKDYIPIFIDKVKEVFIGCDIIIDPLKTYLIIDWS